MRLRVALIAAVLLVASPAPAFANDIQVTTTADSMAPDSACSLREAMTAARMDTAFDGCTTGSGTDRVLLGAGHFTLALDGNDDSSNLTGDLDAFNNGTIVNRLTIAGAGATQTVIDGSGLNAAKRDRVLEVGFGAEVQVQDLTITGGHAPDGAAGADLTGLQGTPGETKDGGSGMPGSGGGGIMNRGTLTLDGVTVADNRAGSGGRGGTGTGGDGTHGSASDAGNGYGGIGGVGGNGGGIDNLGTLAVRNSAIVRNVAGGGGHGGAGNGGVGGVLGNNVGKGGLGQGLPGGDAGWGGGIANAGTLTVERSLIAGDRAGAGGAGGAGNGGDGGHSGAFHGTPGDGLGAPGGAGGWGGGISDANVFPFPRTTVTASSIVGDGSGDGGDGGHAVRGASPATESAGSGGDGGPGGGIMFLDGPGSAANTTFAQNGGGFGGSPGLAVNTGQNGSFGKDSDGFALASRSSTLTLLHVTIADAPPPGVPVLATQGRGILAVLLGKTTLTNSIVVGDCYVNGSSVTLADGGHDIRFQGSGCPGAAGDPKLGDLQANGGPTPTLALGTGSPAIDAVPAGGAGCLPADQRGIARPQLAACDSGAFELTPAPPPVGGQNPAALSVGSVTASPRTFAVGNAPTPLLRTAKAVPRGTTIGFQLSEAARVTIAFARRGAGIKLKAKNGGKTRCVGPSKRNRAALLAQVKRSLGRKATGTRVQRALKKARCTRFVAAGALQRGGLLGANAVKFSGRVGSRALRIGAYRVRVTATDAAGVVSKPADAAFRIVAGAKKKKK